jgi:RNA polymerase-interacting CarD/CdnL/TRCF family regulator
MIVATSLIGCKNSDGNIGKKTETAATVAVIADKDDEKLEGKWAEKHTLDETQKIFKEKSSKIENITKELGIKYTKDEKIKKENDESFNDKSIYFDNENPETNKIESMYFGMKTYGEKLETGDISLKLSLKFDGESAIKNNNFDLGKTSFSKYIQAFTDQENRDYSAINKEIIEKLKNGETVKINNTIDGLKEEIRATKTCIIYKLSTKKYKFSDAEMSMK